MPNEVEETLRCINASIENHNRAIDNHLARIEMLKEERQNIMDKYNIPYSKEDVTE